MSSLLGTTVTTCLELPKEKLKMIMECLLNPVSNTVIVLLDILIDYTVYSCLTITYNIAY